MKKLTVLIMLTLIFLLAACTASRAETAPSAGGDKVKNPDTVSVVVPAVFDEDDLNSSWDGSKISYITFDGDRIDVKGDGVVVDGKKAAITAGGTYYLSGKLDDGQIMVRAEDQEIVRLIMYGVNITCSDNAPIYVFKAKKTVITLADGTENYITDGSNYVFADSTSDEPNAAVFSKADLTINGNGSLTVKANYYNGIQSKDELRITGGNISVDSANDAIKGRDSIAVKYGNIRVTAGGDGLQSNNDGNAEKGNIIIEDGTFDITAAKDGIQAESQVVISGGEITISSGGGSINGRVHYANRGNPWENNNTAGNSTNDDSSVSNKGIKAGINVVINGGSIKVDSGDDAIHSNSDLAINGGNILLASGDDGMHSDAFLEINGGDINIEKSYEGIESAEIEITAGNIRVASSDDGINIIGGNDGFPMMGQPGQTGTNPNIAGNPLPPQDSFSSSGDNNLNIAGGYVYVNADGDGLDINGSMTMSGGTVIVNGPTANDNGAVDCNDFKMTGGYLVAAGSSGMAQGPGNTSTQYSVLVNLTAVQPAGTIFHIESAEGEAVLTFSPVKTYQSVVLCSPQLKNGTSYDVYTGGSSTGTVADGLYSEGIYTPGDKTNSFTVSGMVTNVGTSGRFPWGSGGNMPRR